MIVADSESARENQILLLEITEEEEAGCELSVGDGDTVEAGAAAACGDGDVYVAKSGCELGTGDFDQVLGCFNMEEFTA